MVSKGDKPGDQRWHTALACGLYVVFLLASTLLQAAERRDGRSDPRLCDVVVAGAGGQHHFRVELANTPEQRMQGLQGRHALADNGGMLFDFGAPQWVAMWMKDTPLPLDMLFIDGTGRVVAIAERTVPFSLATIAAPAPVRAVLEVAGGSAARLGLNPGDIVTSPCLGQPAPP